MIDVTVAGLREVAGTELYRRNAFRVTGLPTDADRRAVRRRQQQVLTALQVGADLDLGTPGGPPADLDTVRNAFDRLLGDPRRRLVDEFFWLWGTPAEAGCGCPPALHRDHDAAVRAHSAALDREPAADDRTDEESNEVEALWAEAAHAWERTLRRAACWDHVRHRIAVLDDRQLDESVIDALRDEVPLTLLKPLTDLITARPQDQGRLADRARDWPAPRAAVHDRLEEAAEPRYRAVREATDTASEMLDGGNCAGAARRVYEAVLPELEKLEEIVPGTEHRRTASAANTAAVLLNNCAGALIDLEGSRAERRVKEWLATARKLATDPRTVETIDGNRTAMDQLVAAMADIRRQVDQLVAMGRPEVAASILRDLLRRVGGAAGSAEIRRMLEELPVGSRTRFAPTPGPARGRATRPGRATLPTPYAPHTPARPRSGARKQGGLLLFAVLALIVWALLSRCDVPGDEETATLFAQAIRDNAPAGTCVATLEGWEGDKTRVPVVDCGDAHWGEVLGYPTIGEDPSAYPGDDEAASRSRFRCEELREAQGLPSDTYATAFTWPDEKSWNDGAEDVGDNYATCVVHRLDGDLPGERVSEPEREPDGVVLRMDLFGRETWANPPPGLACVQRRMGAGESPHDVPVVDCDEKHWARIVGYPVLYEPDTPYPGEDAVRAKTEKECRALAESRGLSAGHTLHMRFPDRSWWPLGPFYAVCLAVPEDGGGGAS
ncbi:hypothetical protein [Streptomyces macrosporus]|uniref:hypothetical protein n=1 Tax=Streptomyces macrosporus TaxID=44032 RepID=UPI0031CFFE0D